MNELAVLISVSPATIKDQIKRLKDKGMIRCIGPDNGGHWEIVK
ncbi:MAG: winged helix-turn-helix transcriptional regulator [Acidobacteriota bacterium]|jgi:DNA-binding Lrp family transcriptional regulator|nr:winged helix-turn-helix transcriptional regulator [Acidobacteriota bacterium]